MTASLSPLSISTLVFVDRSLLLWMICLAIVLLPLQVATGCDTSLNMYTQGGELAQVFYAAKAVERHGPLVFSFLTDNEETAVAVVVKRHESSLASLAQRISPTPIELYDNQVAAIFAGYKPDVTYIQSYINSVTRDHRFIYGESPSLYLFASKISRFLTIGLYDREEHANSDYDDDNGEEDETEMLARPLAASILLLGSSMNQLESSHKATIYRVHNSGAFEKCLTAVLGSISNPSRIEIKKLIEALTLEKSKALAVIQKVVAFIRNKLEDKKELESLQPSDDLLEYECCIFDSKSGCLMQTSKALEYDGLLEFVDLHANKHKEDI